MKKKFLTSILSLVLVAGFTMLGCSSDDSGESGLGKAESVSLEKLQNDFPGEPTGTGEMPSNETDTEQVMDDFDYIDNAVDDSVQEAAVAIVKASLKNDLGSISSLKMEKSDTYSDHGKWDEEGTADLTVYDPWGLFTDGTVDYDFLMSNSSSNYEEDPAEGEYEWGYEGNTEGSFKYKYNDVQPFFPVAMIISGYKNQNFTNSWKRDNTQDTTTLDYKAITIVNNAFISIRVGYKISGNTYCGYCIFSADLKTSINKSLTEAELADVNNGSITLGDLIDENTTGTGSGTITFYNAAGEVVYTQTFTAEELMDILTP